MTQQRSGGAASTPSPPASILKPSSFHILPPLGFGAADSCPTNSGDGRPSNNAALKKNAFSPRKVSFEESPKEWPGPSSPSIMLTPDHTAGFYYSARSSKKSKDSKSSRKGSLAAPPPPPVPAWLMLQNMQLQAPAISPPTVTAAPQRPIPQRPQKLAHQNANNDSATKMIVPKPSPKSCRAFSFSPITDDPTEEEETKSNSGASLDNELSSAGSILFHLESYPPPLLPSLPSAFRTHSRYADPVGFEKEVSELSSSAPKLQMRLTKTQHQYPFYGL